MSLHFLAWPEPVASVVVTEKTQIRQAAVSIISAAPVVGNFTSARPFFEGLRRPLQRRAREEQLERLNASPNGCKACESDVRAHTKIYVLDLEVSLKRRFTPALPTLRMSPMIRNPALL